MLQIEGAIADAIGLEQCRPFFALATTIVANGDLGPQQYYGVATVSAIRQVEVLRGLEPAARSERLIERAGSLEQGPPCGKIRAHPEDTISTHAVDSFWLVDA